MAGSADESRLPAEVPHAFVHGPIEFSANTSPANHFEPVIARDGFAYGLSHDSYSPNVIQPRSAYCYGDNASYATPDQPEQEI